MNCPLCLSTNHQEFDQDKLRSYLECLECELIFVPRSSLISSKLEKERYEEHENSEDDEGYRNYLNKIALSLKEYLSSNDRGLDYGCGKTTLLANLLKPLDINSYDLYFHPNEEILKESYDFIILSEVIEHLGDPRETMINLCQSLGSSGKLFIKTKLRPGQVKEFSNWFYKRDVTHVQFFNETSLNKLMNICDFKEVREIGSDLFYFSR